MKKLTKEQIHNTMTFCLHSLLWGLVFVVVGYYVPRIYWEHFDQKVYYEVETPIQVDKEVYNAGDIMILSSTNTSLVTTRMDIVGRLVLVDVDTKRAVYYQEISVPIREGMHEFELEARIPEDTGTGKYRWEGIGVINVHDVDKTYKWFTEEFEVINE